MRQTLALLIDAYREMNARKMFWITLILSAAFVGIFGLLGADQEGWTFFGKRLRVPDPIFWYKWTFSVFIIGIWSKWAALILALISTASIFPDLLTSGSIDLYLSKPIGRVRLFLTKYFSGLLFVALQSAVISLGSFLIFGLRVGQWRPSLFLMVPLIVLLFSYLFCFCTLIGVMTRSTIAAVLLTVLFWFICFGVNWAEGLLFEQRVRNSTEARVLDAQVRQADAELRNLKASPSISNMFGIRARHIEQRRERLRVAAREAQETADFLNKFHRIAHWTATFIPKTGETVNLLDRKMFDDADLAVIRRLERGGGAEPIEPPPDYEVSIAESSASTSAPSTSPTTTAPTTQSLEAAAEAQDRARAREDYRKAKDEAVEASQRALLSRSVPWILGTSLGFEAVILVWACWIFWRRDY